MRAKSGPRRGLNRFFSRNFQRFNYASHAKLSDDEDVEISALCFFFSLLTIKVGRSLIPQFNY